jgi:hypothetical protein
MPTKRQRRKRRRRLSNPDRASAGPGEPIASATGAGGSKQTRTGRHGSETLSATPGPAGARSRRDARPAAPWGSFPLTEIVIFIGVVLLIAGFFFPPPQGLVMLAVGLGLASLAGLELSIREHFAAYRSHTLLLSAAIGVPVFGALFLATKLSPAICVAAGLLAFGGAAWLFASAFSRRSGGALYRLKG